MSTSPEFVEFPSITRLSRECIITEKIDGTNACIYVADDGSVFAGSRTRWLTLETDNFGFARWAQTNREGLLTLGPGRHFGEWWGYGIQRGYGMKEKRFSLFNVTRWGDEALRPLCCSVVPVLYRGIFDTIAVEVAIEALAKYGSLAAPGFMQPEGVVVLHSPSGSLFKKTIHGDDQRLARRLG